VDWFAALMQRAVAAYTKSYPENAPQNTAFPYATFLDVTENRPQILGGFDLEFARVQIDVWALSVADARAGMETLLSALVPGVTANGHTFQRADIVLGPRSVGGERQGDTIIYRRSADLMIPHD
jgi:hypothetical protein